MHLNTEKKKVTVWLAKVPKYLGEQILKHTKQCIVGKLSIERMGDAPKIGITLSDAMKKCNIPTDYTISIKEQDQQMYIVKNEEDSFSTQGVVNKECFIKPVINAKYLDYKKAINAQLESSENTVKVIDYFAEVRKGEKYGSLKELDILAKKRKKQLQDKKRERLDKQDVLDMIFNAFEKHEFWTVRDLADFSGQPVAYIQELVSEICVLNKKDHKNTYELKPEYKNQ